jgi:nicotinate-nucleotide pyrophosphorylase (carboxylating)
MNIDRSSIIALNVKHALEEDVGTGDITAQLIPKDKNASAKIITRDHGILCGKEWVDEVFRIVDPTVILHWEKLDGDAIKPNDTLFTAAGSARSLLTAERCALNFLQTLSGTATVSRRYADMVSHTQVKLLDTRKTLPGLRIAQKFAVKCGGCFNHRIGLYDAFLIKENHIISCGSIFAAVKKAHQIAPGKPVEVEVESLDEFQQALDAKADIIMLDNFSNDDKRQAVAANRGHAKLEASGGITEDTLAGVAETGVDYISIGALTKDCKSIDLSMRIEL